MSTKVSKPSKPKYSNNQKSNKSKSKQTRNRKTKQNNNKNKNSNKNKHSENSGKSKQKSSKSRKIDNNNKFNNKNNNNTNKNNNNTNGIYKNYKRSNTYTQEQIQQISIRALQEKKKTKSLGEEYLHEGKFDLARQYFEAYLRPTQGILTGDLKDIHDVKSKLLLCRLNCNNIESSLINGISECKYLLSYYDVNRKVKMFQNKQNKENDIEKKLSTNQLVDTTKVKTQTPKRKSQKSQKSQKYNPSLSNKSNKSTKSKKSSKQNKSNKFEKPTKEDPSPPLFSESKLFLMQSELNVRLSRWKDASECVLKATQCDLKEKYLDSVYLYLHTLKENTPQLDKYEKESPFKKLQNKINFKELEEFFNSLTIMGQQNVFSIEWNEIHNLINSNLCDKMLPTNLNDKQKEKLKLFLKMILDWNLPNNVEKAEERNKKRMSINDYNIDSVNISKNKLSKQMIQEKYLAKSLIFLKTLFLQLSAKNVWDNLVNILPPKPDSEKTKKLEDILSPEDESTHFVETGLYVCRDGYDFSGLAAFEQSQSLSTLFELISRKNNKSLLMLNSLWLYNTGFRFINWIANESGYYVKYLENIECDAYNMTNSEWLEFYDARIQAQLSSDILLSNDMNCMSRSNDAQEDSKKFEEGLEKLVGLDKKNKLMQLELDMSLPILKKYAKIMSDISGIDEDLLLFELTVPEDDELQKQKLEIENEQKEENTESTDKNNEQKKKENIKKKSKTPTITSDLLKEYLKNPKFKDYKPVGLPVLIQLKPFNIVPSNIPNPECKYNKKQVLNDLKLLEKEVVQFQINYKKKVKQVLENKANDVEKEMNTLQKRGLELTKWLRGFVKYMIAKRDVEQQIVDTSKKSSWKLGIKWFEDISNYVNGASDILLRLIGRYMLFNLIKYYLLYKEPSAFKEAKLLTKKRNQLMKMQSQNKSEEKQEIEKTEIEEKEKEEKNKITIQELSKIIGLPLNKNDNLLGDKIETVAAKYFEARVLVQFYQIVNETYLTKPVNKLNNNENNSNINKNKKKSILKLGFNQFRQAPQKNKSNSIYSNGKNNIIDEIKIDNLNEIEKTFKNKILCNKSVESKLNFIKNKLGYKNISVPILSVNLNLQVIKSILLGQTLNPYMYNTPYIRQFMDEMKIFVSRCKYSKENIFCILYSEIDKQIYIHMTVNTLPNKYFACYGCDKVFASLRCGNCGLAYYCSKNCQELDWKNHQNDCKTYKSYGIPNITFNL